jgi:ABC-type dipeptide/oligopeptide/nickel transport system permease component
VAVLILVVNALSGLMAALLDPRLRADGLAPVSASS